MWGKNSANVTDSSAVSVHGTNPQNLVEKILRAKIYNHAYWKEHCFGLTAESLVDKAMEVEAIGGTYGGIREPTSFIQLTLKMLQIQPEKEIVVEFIKNEDYKYVRALGAYYMRLTGKAVEVYQYLEPLYNDYRKLRRRQVDGSYTLTRMDEFIDELLRADYVLDIALPHLPKRLALEASGQLRGPRRSALEEELDEEERAQAEEKERPLRLAILGRPNAGKSTLLNALLGEERMIVGPEPGLTRDAIASEWNDGEGMVRLVDTAGLRRKARIEDKLEAMSAQSSIAALKECEVVVLVLDALLGMEEQDLRIARLAEREGRALVIALNKWDAVEDRVATRKKLDDVLMASFAQMKGIAIVTMSAATGRGVDRLMPTVRGVLELWNKRVPTGALNRWFEEALERHQPPLVQGKRLKLRYATMPKARPPTMVVFGTRAELLPVEYQRYLVNSFREAFHMPGVPIRLQMRGTENPFADQE